MAEATLLDLAAQVAAQVEADQAASVQAEQAKVNAAKQAARKVFLDDLALSLRADWPDLLGRLWADGNMILQYDDGMATAYASITVGGEEWSLLRDARGATTFWKLQRPDNSATEWVSSNNIGRKLLLELYTWHQRVKDRIRNVA